MEETTRLRWEYNIKICYKEMWRDEIEWTGVPQAPAAGCCGKDNESSVSTENVELLG
jgi:hypothetical protein